MSKTEISFAGKIKTTVKAALNEDIGAGDVTSEAIIPKSAEARAFIVAREEGIVAGLPVAEEVFSCLSKRISFRPLVADGAAVRRGAKIAEVRGNARKLLAGERVALNFLQRMSGIATLTNKCVKAVKGYDCVVMDTRKTTPGLRELEKYAVRVGGGMNHRMGLYDQVLIKDNHIESLRHEGLSLVEAVAAAVKRAREHVSRKILIEVEVESLEMLGAAVEAGADIIMLDNMTIAEMRKACRIVRERRRKGGKRFPVTEASGGIRLENVRAVASTGVDRVSLGMLTHSLRALDIAMDIEL